MTKFPVYLASIILFLKTLFTRFGFEMVRRGEMSLLWRLTKSLPDLRFVISMLRWLPQENLGYLFSESRGQLRQDVFVLAMLGTTRSGYFVEAGATNGVSLSNSYLLESIFHWKGLLVEPARSWHAELIANRGCLIDFRALYSVGGEQVDFIETPSRELSSVESFSQLDGHSHNRQGGEKYCVETVTLCELLEVHRAPTTIDYLSLDTEGTELNILSAFDFTKYTFRVITVEHNFSPARDQIFMLLQRNGYLRVFTELSRWDDWYLHASVVGDLGVEHDQIVR